MNALQETFDELDELDFEQNGYSSGNGHDNGQPFSEEEEMELAFELLEVSSDEELDEFIGKLWKKAKRFAKSKAGRAIGSVLKKVAKKALPLAGGAIGTFVGGPVGGAIGGKLGSVASNMFEMELEGMSPEDQEFEVAKRFVRFAGEATSNAAKLAGKVPEDQAVKIAVNKAAKKYAPGLLKHNLNRLGKQQGRWVKKGRRIILMGV